MMLYCEIKQGLYESVSVHKNTPHNGLILRFVPQGVSARLNLFSHTKDSGEVRRKKRRQNVMRRVGKCKGLSLGCM
jgi:hypothetical protein